MKILVVDDESNIREGMSKYIRLHTDRFDEVLTAANGEEALDNIIKYHPEVMLLDIQIPKKNGLEVMKESKKAGLMPVTIILSCHEDFSYAREALHLGATEYMLKPIRATDLLASINQICDEKFAVPVRKESSVKSTNSYVDDAVSFIKEHYNEAISQETVAEKLGISTGYLSTLFKQSLNTRFVDFLNSVRIEKACSYLTQNSLKSYEIAYKVGFNDEKYFSRVFKKMKGVSPMEYKKMN